MQMAGEMEKLFSAAGRIYVLLRRETNRMIDVEWVIVNAAYAREVIQLARATGLPELAELAERIEETHPLLPPVVKAAVPAQAVPTAAAAVQPAATTPAAQPAEAQESKYISTLR